MSSTGALMIQARLKEMQERARSTRRRVRSPRPPSMKLPLSLEREYWREIRAVLEKTKKAVEEILLPRLPSIVERVDSQKPKQRTDNAPDDFVKAMEQLRLQVERDFSEQEIRRIAQQRGMRVAAVQKALLERNIRRVVGIDPLIADTGLRRTMELFIAENVELIKNMRQEQLNRIESRVFAGFRSGERAETIAKAIQRNVDPLRSTSANRARLIARDQVASLAGKLNETRQTELGIQRYRWETVGDERVRTEHEELDGQEFSWDDPPVSGVNGERQHPGQPINCRCVSIPVIL
jgi:SPP1 gp7 family putative phage head morphogenesis protein